ncbi:MAG: phosphomannomutase/phosphoglucomutase [Bacillota bacterium]
MADINLEIFREYDIRGSAEKDLTPGFVFLLGKVIGKYFRDQGEDLVLVGRDNRLSSGRIRDNLVAGLNAAGCKITDIGVAVSPLFYYARILYCINAGVMITASHNPAEFNGFKIANGPGTIYGDEIKSLGKLAAEMNRTELINPQTVDESKVEMRDPAPSYLMMLCEKIKLGPRKIKVVVDCGNGTAGLFAERFFHMLGCEVIPLFCESDGNFPNHHPDPVKSSHLKWLQETVLREKADAGIGFDGDGDRLGVVDDKGGIIWGDRLMILYWREILPQYPGIVSIVEVKCSQTLVEEIIKLGGKPMFYRTGHSLIKAKMREIGAVFTGEMSGHMFFADEYYGFDDALYAAGRLLRILSRTSKSLSELFEDVPRYPSTAETRVFCADKDKFRVVEDIRDQFRKTNEVIDVDGARILFSGGWGLVRASNTQPVIVARCEGKNNDDLQEIADKIRRALLSFPEVTPFEWDY